MTRRTFILIVYLLIFAAGAYAQTSGNSKHYPNPEKIAKARAIEEEALEKNDSTLLAEAYYMYGKAYAHGGLYENADTYFLKSMRIVERGGDSYELGRLHLRLAETEMRLTGYERAIAEVTKAAAIFERINSKKGLQTAYLYLGYLHRKVRNFPKGMEYLKKAEKVCIELGDNQALAEVYLHMGTHLIKERNKTGFLYLEKARNLFEETGDRVNMTTVLANIAMGHMDFSNNREAGAALTEAQKVYGLLKSPNLTLKIIMQDAVVRYFQKTGQWKGAFEQLLKRRLLDSENLKAQQDSVIRRLHAEFETEKKEALLAAQQNEIELVQENLQLERKGNYFLLAALSLSVVFLFILYRLYLKNRRLSKQNANLVREQGHRIRNHLQMISNMLQLNSGILSDPEAKATLVESELRVQSIALLQKGIYSKEKGAEVFLPEYFTLLTDHVLEVSGYERVEKQLEIEDIFLHPDRALPVALILNELVTNSCKYAFPGHPSPQLKVLCRKERERICFRVADNGPGFVPPLPGAEQSFGMQLIRIQAEQLYAVYSFQNDPQTGGAGFEMEFSV